MRITHHRPLTFLPSASSPEDREYSEIVTRPTEHASGTSAKALRLLQLFFVVAGLIAVPSFAGGNPSPGVHGKFLFIQANASAPPDAYLKPRVPVSKPSRKELAERQADDSAIVKFTEGTGIRLRGSNFVVLDSDIEVDRAARQRVTPSLLAVQVEIAKEILQRNGAIIERALTTDENKLREQRRTGEEKSREELADLNLFYNLRFPGKSAASVVNVLDMMNQLEVVEYAVPKVKVAPQPGDISPPTPLFTANQGYFAAAPAGIDVGYARLLPGGRGEGLRVVDIEDGWIADHEDFPTLISTSGNNYQVLSFRYHATSVIGVLAALENDYGMTGIAPALEISIASIVVGNDDHSDLPDSVQRAYNQSRPGDIILVEQQVYYNAPSDTSNCPPEWGTDSLVFDLVKAAVANGRIVIETAGNGSQNLDDTARFGTRFNRNVEDSGAIYVGAGSPNTHSPEPDTNFGSRIDVQGWGDNIATLGASRFGPDLFFPNGDIRQSYTNMFAGTSGAAPIVTGAAAILQAVRRARALPPLTSQQMRVALLIGATPQGAGVNIGPLPNLHTAIAAIPVPAPTIAATGSANGTASISWGAIAAVAGYEVFRKDGQNSSWSLIGTTTGTSYPDTGLTAARTYLYRVRAYDAAGNRSSDSNYDLATTIDYTDPQLSMTTRIRAKHMIDVRTAVNSLCTYAGTAICPVSPFAGDALNQSLVQTQRISANDFNAVRNQIVSLRASIGASPATFRETVTPGLRVRFIHMEDLRTGAN